jgi:hypothetical protein
MFIVVLFMLEAGKSKNMALASSESFMFHHNMAEGQENM